MLKDASYELRCFWVSSWRLRRLIFFSSNFLSWTLAIVKMIIMLYLSIFTCSFSCASRWLLLMAWSSSFSLQMFSLSEPLSVLFPGVSFRFSSLFIFSSWHLISTINSLISWFLKWISSSKTWKAENAAYFNSSRIRLP